MSHSEPSIVPPSMDHGIDQHCHAGTIVLSYFISVTGSYCTIQLMEQWRLHSSRFQKRQLLVLSSIALGGCGIWGMHFTGMMALQMDHEQTHLEVHFEAVLTLISLLVPILGVFVGLQCASMDPFFREIEEAQRKEILESGLKHLPIDMLAKRHQLVRRITVVALFSRLWRIGCGGFFAAAGVLGMHYLGMIAQRTHATMQIDVNMIIVSSIVALISAVTSFWILFHVLTFWPEKEFLRIVSALIMSLAVCGTHYTGMYAATYTYSEEDHGASTAWVFHGPTAASIASYGSLLLCYWMCTIGVVRTLQMDAMESAAAAVTSSRGQPDAVGTTASIGIAAAAIESRSDQEDPYHSATSETGTTTATAALAQPGALRATIVASLQRMSRGRKSSVTPQEPYQRTDLLEPSSFKNASTIRSAAPVDSLIREVPGSIP